MEHGHYECTLCRCVISIYLGLGRVSLWRLATAPLWKNDRHKGDVPSRDHLSRRATPEFSRITSAKGKISPEYSASENVHYSFDGGEDRGGEKFLTLESIVRRDDWSGGMRLERSRWRWTNIVPLFYLILCVLYIKLEYTHGRYIRR